MVKNQTSLAQNFAMLIKKRVYNRKPSKTISTKIWWARIELANYFIGRISRVETRVFTKDCLKMLKRCQNWVKMINLARIIKFLMISLKKCTSIKESDSNSNLYAQPRRWMLECFKISVKVVNTFNQ